MQNDNQQNSKIPQLEYGHIFTGSSIMHETGEGDKIATFDVTVREATGERNFLLAGGIEKIVNQLPNWSYDKEFVDYLLEKKVISEEFSKYLKNFSFTGDVYAIPNGTVFFPKEPVVRITTSLCDANLLTAFLINAINFPTRYLSKAVRFRLACDGKRFSSVGAVRVTSFDNIKEIHKLGYMLGSSTALPYFNFSEVIGESKTAANLNHALIQSFDEEIEAFRHFLPYTDSAEIATSMIDTYDIEKGTEKWIKVEKEAREEGKSLGSISLDSGDLYEVSKLVRQKLDEAGLEDVDLVAYSKNEYKVKELEKRGAPIDMHIASTAIINSTDGPVLEVVYKLAETRDKEGSITYSAKLTPGKLSFPGRKQVFRKFNNNGKIEEDIIGLEEEDLGEPIMTKYIENGEKIEDPKSIEETKEEIDKQLDTLPEKYKEIGVQHDFPVSRSQKINEILEDLREKHA